MIFILLFIEHMFSLCYTVIVLLKGKQDVIFRLLDALWFTKEGDAHEHNGSSHFVVSNIHGIDLHRSA